MLKTVVNVVKMTSVIQWVPIVLFGLTVVSSGCSVTPKSISSHQPSPFTTSDKVQHSHGYSDYIQARLLVAKGEVDHAHAALDRAISADPESVYLYAAQASLYLDHGKSEQAYPLLMTALQLDADDLTSQLLLADLLHARGGSEDRARAMTLFHRALQQHPDLDELYIHLARLHLQGDDFAQASAVLNQYLQRQPDALLGLMEYARLQRLEGEWLRADETYRKVIILYPDHRRAYVLLGQLLEQRKRVDEALAIYRQGREATADYFYFDHLISAILMQYERYDEADKVIAQRLEDDPLDADALSKRGLIYFESEKWSEAEALFRLAIVRQPVSQLYYWLGYSLDQQQKWSEAVASYQHVEEPVALKYQALEHLSRLHAQLGNFDQAATALESLLKHSGEGRLDAQPQAYLQLALYYHYQQKKQQVLQAIKWGMDQFPANASLYFALGIYYHQYHQPLLMEEALRRTIELKNDHAGALNHLAYTYAEAGKNLDEALAMSLKAVALLTQQDGYSDGATLDTLGWVYYKLGRYEEARQAVEQAVAKIPEDLSVQEHLGDIYSALGLYDLAAQRYQTILHQAADTPSVVQKLKAIQP